MALTTTPTAAILPAHVRRTDVVALVCAVSAGTHAALVGPHVRESVPLAGAFVLAATALSVAAFAQAVAPGAFGSRVVAALLLALAVAYVLSRATGIPGLVEYPEPWDPVGVPLAVLEAAAAVLVVRQPHPRRHR